MVQAAAGVLGAAALAGGAAVVAGRRSAHTLDEGFDISSAIVKLQPLPPPREDGQVRLSPY